MADKQRTDKRYPPFDTKCNHVFIFSFTLLSCHWGVLDVCFDFLNQFQFQLKMAEVLLYRGRSRAFVFNFVLFTAFLLESECAVLVMATDAAVGSGNVSKVEEKVMNVNGKLTGTVKRRNAQKARDFPKKQVCLRLSCQANEF
ncbi:uncharacterized protein LOC111591675 [Ceratitis capitata]|uniref:uncharacterized protein LOC111591675 n=1 Tax=Ceratitis capitata TaxID=7213 RepID=UPI000C6C558A|nr:uncharacterized protein LOC111591675 [Ceratitis capitata]